MKNLAQKNASNLLISLIVMITLTVSANAQTVDEPIFFLLDNTSEQYIIKSDFNNMSETITLYDKKTYMKHKKLKAEAEKKGTYCYNPESGLDNLNTVIHSLTFKIISKKIVALDSFKIDHISFVDYNWILHNEKLKYKRDDEEFIELNNFSNLSIIIMRDQTYHICKVTRVNQEI